MSNQKLSNPKILSANRLRSFLPKRDPAMHKGDCGQVLIVGGNMGMGGAVYLSALGSAISGAGVTRVVTHPYYAKTLWYNLPEIMVYPCEDLRILEKFLAQSDVCVLGPGLGSDEMAITLFRQVMSSSVPKVIDAQALGLLSQYSGTLDRTILTPHPGEAAQLLGTTVEVIQSDRQASLTELCTRFDRCVVVLKGHETLIGYQNQRSICKAGSACMAVAGMGDLLSGLIGGLVAQGLNPLQASELGVWLHAKAGEDWAKKNGARGLLTHEIAFEIRNRLNTL